MSPHEPIQKPTTEEHLGFLLHRLLDLREDTRFLEERIRSAQQTGVTLPYKEVYSIEDIAYHYDMVQEQREKIDLYERQLEEMKSLRKETKREIAEYLPPGLKVEWERSGGEYYIIENLSGEDKSPEISLRPIEEE